MRDWNALVRKLLSLAALSPEQRDETIAELASHLDDLCEDYRTHGLTRPKRSHARSTKSPTGAA